MFEFIIIIAVVSFFIKLCVVASVFVKSGRRHHRASATHSRNSNSRSSRNDFDANDSYCANNQQWQATEQNRLFMEQMDRDMQNHMEQGRHFQEQVHIDNSFNDFGGGFDDFDGSGFF